MSLMTTTVRNILMQNIHEDESLLKPSDVYAVGMRCIFNNSSEPLALISNEYREMFCTYFLNHFMNDEIGQETVGVFQENLNAKIMENAYLVNLKMANLDKAVYSRYAVHRVDRTSEHELEKSNTSEDTATDTDTGSASNRLEETASNEVSGTSGNTRTLDTDSTTTDTGTVGNQKTGSDLISSSGSDELETTGTDEVASSGRDVRTVADDYTDSHTGGNTTTNHGEETGSTTDSETNKENGVHIVYDTPQGSLQNMRTPGGDATGTGVAYVNGQTYNYMSSAEETNATNVKSGTGSSTRETDDTSGVVYDEQNTHDGDSTDTMAYGKTDTTTYGKVDTTTYGKTDTTTYGSNDTETRNLTNKKLDTGTIADAGTKHEQGESSKLNVGTNTTSNTKNHTGSSEGSGTESGTSHDVEETIDYEITSEMLFKSQSIMRDIMRLFDSCFSLFLGSERM